MKSTGFTLETLKAKVQALTRPERFAHILRVAELAQAIAEANGLDAQRAYLAALLHDAARDLPEDELVRLAPPENDVERSHPLAVHGRAARRLAEEWGVTDAEVLDAIEGHVYGVTPSNRIGMAVYIADVSEPARGVNAEIREMALAGRLEEAYRQAIVSKVTYLREKGVPVHPRTLLAYDAVLA